MFDELCRQLLTCQTKDNGLLRGDLVKAIENACSNSGIHPLLAVFSDEVISFFEILSVCVFENINKSVTDWQICVFVEYLRSQRCTETELVDIALGIGVDSHFMTSLIAGIIDAQKQLHLSDAVICKFVIWVTYYIATRDDAVSEAAFTWDVSPRDILEHHDNQPRSYYGPVDYLGHAAIQKVMYGKKASRLLGIALQDAVEGRCFEFTLNGCKSDDNSIRGFNTILWMCTDFCEDVILSPSVGITRLAQQVFKTAYDTCRADMMYSMWLWIPTTAALHWHQMIHMIDKKQDELKSLPKITKLQREKKFGVTTLKDIISEVATSRKSILTKMVFKFHESTPLNKSNPTILHHQLLFQLLEEILFVFDHVPTHRQNGCIAECMSVILAILHQLPDGQLPPRHIAPTGEADVEDVEERILRIIVIHLRRMGVGDKVNEWMDAWLNVYQKIAPAKLAMLASCPTLSHTWFQTLSYLLNYPIATLNKVKSMSDPELNNGEGENKNKKEKNEDDGGTQQPMYYWNVSPHVDRLKKYFEIIYDGTFPVLLMSLEILYQIILNKQSNIETCGGAIWWSHIINGLANEYSEYQLILLS